MKNRNNLRTLGISALAAVGLSQAGVASPAAEDGIRAIDRLQQIRADYLKAIGKPELAHPDGVQIAQWQNFPNFGNFPNWANGWQNY
ncbi:MAG: hypothetical protein AAAB35_03040 [Phyllobacterium sp.]|uniref:hypothetical protein n=1 Tax=Phyllobacterium sp. TaxID=1871046 RepID=UPI0030F26C57